jgi:hypothetical protein
MDLVEHIDACNLCIDEELNLGGQAFDKIIDRLSSVRRTVEFCNQISGSGTRTWP